ncbi:MAG: hypothetical protein K2N48_03295 [Muribaculaceae bacterium]|nr:hypothetical protein [Muribaculaceae bacterium]
MKHIAVLLLSVFFVVSSVLAKPDLRNSSDNQEDSLNSKIGVHTETMLLSDESGVSSLLQGIIPPSPQAAALARYAEYPVSHTTGIPDISIPLYEIRMGELSFPISISYHSSGARPDEIPTCVGLGWTLNAGGAITRTILGGPDIEVSDEAIGDYRYYDRNNVDALISQIKTNRGNGHLRELTNPLHTRDSEADRFCFNAGGHTGVFRYSYKEKEYVCLDGSSCIVSSYGHGKESYFNMICPDNTVYEFKIHEKTGIDPDETDPFFTTSWYVSCIYTPYGEVKFKYLDTSDRFYVNHNSNIFRSGFYPRVEEIMQNVSYLTYYEFAIKGNEIKGPNMYYDQKHVSSIEWNGNRIEFEYAPGNADDLNLRLKRMTVTTSSGDIVKTVDFGNDVPWKTGTSRGRRMLRSLTDSQAGTYTFSYDTGKTLPPMFKEGNPSTCTDSWGYYNGGSGSVLSRDLAEWLAYDENDSIQPLGKLWSNKSWRDRNPKLEYAKLGILDKIVFPTGGSVTYRYELNELDSVKYGGLRVASIETQDGGLRLSKKYIYSGGKAAQMHPDSLSKYVSYLRIHNSYNPTRPMTRRYRTVMSSPAYSAFSKSAPVLYSDVKEILSDGSYIEYKYDLLANTVPASRKDWNHPSSFPEALTDRGNNTPVLKSKSVYSSGNVLQFRETNSYLSNTVRSIATGIRIISVIDLYTYTGGEEGYVSHEDEFQDGVAESELLVRETWAERIATVLKSTVTEDFTTGFSNTVTYAYDDLYRTLMPVSIKIANSDGSTVETRYEYPFHRNGDIYADMMENGYNDQVVAVKTFHNNLLISKKETEFGFAGKNTSDSYDHIMPFAYSSWLYPTSSTTQTPSTNIPERERVSGYNSSGRPLSITVNGTDVTSFTWDTAGVQLLSSTAPGGLTTTYTHRPLFGLASVTQPNGYKLSYLYNSAGMLRSVSDNAGVVEEYTYSISGHPTMKSDGNSVTTRRRLNSTGSNSILTKQNYSGLGLESTLIQGGFSTSGRYVYSTTGYDALGRACESILPGVGGKTPEPKTYSEVIDLSKATYGEEYVRSQTTLDALDRPVKVTTPGDAWRAQWKGKTIEYISNSAGSVRLYRASMSSLALSDGGYYAAKTLQGVRTVDEDGHEITVYTDRLGRKVLERRGPESGKGQNDTYFVYNALGQLRFVLSPGYQEDADLAEYAYEYRYDQHGNVVYKALPGAGYTQYWYDRAGRLTFIQDPNLRAKALYRFFVYDKAGRQVIQGVCKVCTRNEAANVATYTGGSSGFMSTGYTLTYPARIQQALLECIYFYDSYTFVTSLDTCLAKGGTASPKGLQTGSVIFASDGSSSMAALYYDVKGRVVEHREVTSFGTQRVTTQTYTYSGQPLKTSMTEGGMTVETENTYHAGSGLLTAKYVTVNGVKQCVSTITYDDLGRTDSIARGSGQNSGGIVTYTYNIHGQTTSVSGPGFSQTLHYADGPGTKLYNGSVSAMKWSTGSSSYLRGYKYTYNYYGWLTAADYSEGILLTANKDRFSEKSTAFTLNGGITRLQRNGLMADGTYGKVDDLTVGYTGNRATGVADAAPPVTQNGSMDYPNNYTSNILSYNTWGALTGNPGRGITSITYDNLGNPLKIQYSGGQSTSNVYSASGEKLKTVHSTNVAAQASALPLTGSDGISMLADDIKVVVGTDRSVVEYHGNVIYHNGKADTVLFPGGYATIEGTAVTFHYYTQDYLGNNRAVINGSTGAIEQTVSYYPYGGVIPGLSTNLSAQPYKFGGKELITANGLNEYDFGARQYFSAVPGFTKPDPLSEKYYWLSPYLYCANNPVNYVDPSGMVVIGLDNQARQNIIYSLPEEEAMFVRFNDDGVIDAELLNKCASHSDNFEALRSVVNSKTSFYVSTASQYTSGERTRELKNAGMRGTVGVTLMPDAPEEPSPDENVYIYTSNRIPVVEQVENLAHELYAHGLFYELNSMGKSVNPFHEFKWVDKVESIPGSLEQEYYFEKVDFNTELDSQIKKVTTAAKRNYNNRFK